MEKVYHHDQMVRLCARALGQGAERLSQYRIRWNVAGDCQSPVVLERVGRPEGRETWRQAVDRIKALPIDSADLDGVDALGAPRVRRHSLRYVLSGAFRRHGLLLEAHTRCRRCARCLSLRHRAWQARARAETGHWPRTWFGTLTLRSEEQFRFLTIARNRLGIQGIDFDALPYGEQFIERHREINRELTKYLKRLRKATRAPFRYLLVAEQHKSGAPHYHLLLHECDAGLPVKHKVLSEQWSLGFTQFKLVSDMRQATYLTKYLSKSLVARVRASKGYGALEPSKKEAVANSSRDRVDALEELPHRTGKADFPMESGFPALTDARESERSSEMFLSGRLS